VISNPVDVTENDGRVQTFFDLCNGVSPWAALRVRGAALFFGAARRRTLGGERPAPG
jgi:hypothetical protein